MSLSTILRSIFTGLVAIFAFILTMLILAYTLGLEQYSLNDLTNKVGGVHVFIALIVSIMSTSYFIFWSIEDSLKKEFNDYTKELVNNLKKINNELTVTYELIKELNVKIENNENVSKELKERVLAIEKLLAELIDKAKR